MNTAESIAVAALEGERVIAQRSKLKMTKKSPLDDLPLNARSDEDSADYRALYDYLAGEGSKPKLSRDADGIMLSGAALLRVGGGSYTVAIKAGNTLYRVNRVAREKMPKVPLKVVKHDATD